MAENLSLDRLTSYVEWVRNGALPTWAERGWDAAAGRFRERLQWDGDPLVVPHRSMVQARQIYVYASAARTGWFASGGELAEVAMASLIRDFGQQENDRFSVAFSIDHASGSVVSPVRDAYAHAFFLFAIAALYDLNGDPRLLGMADATIRFIDERMTDPLHGGLFDALPVTSTMKRQNPHMHLLEAFLALDRAAPGRGYGARAGELVALFKRHFLRTPPGVLLEYFSADWSDCDVANLAGIWEPGHHFEWVWLLTEARRSTSEMVDPWITGLYDLARMHGVSADGCIYDEVSSELLVVKPSRRLWPHTEAIKAAMARSEGGDTGAAAFADAMAARLLDTFVARPFAGGWIDHLSSEGAPLVDYVPASSLYHLFFAAREGAKLLPSTAPII